MAFLLGLPAFLLGHSPLECRPLPGLTLGTLKGFPLQSGGLQAPTPDLQLGLFELLPWGPGIHSGWSVTQGPTPRQLLLSRPGKCGSSHRRTPICLCPDAISGPSRRDRITDFPNPFLQMATTSGRWRQKPKETCASR